MIIIFRILLLKLGWEINTTNYIKNQDDIQGLSCISCFVGHCILYITFKYKFELIVWICNSIKFFPGLDKNNIRVFSQQPLNLLVKLFMIQGKFQDGIKELSGKLSK